MTLEYPQQNQPTPKPRQPEDISEPQWTALPKCHQKVESQKGGLPSSISDETLETASERETENQVMTSSHDLQSSSEDKIPVISSGLVIVITITISRIDILLKIWKVFGTRIPAVSAEKAISRLNDCKVGNTVRSKSVYYR